ncbi:MAG: NAD-dependent epimerase/dehydratase family protein [Magnetococcales bacterium]|nr:NAD-dependent epimerase/dehydratase family protein [Magnetococcales bacterium]
MATLFVTGGSGFVGGHLVARLLREGHEVRVLTRERARVVAGAQAVVGELLEPESYRQAMAGCERVFHAAAAITFRAAAFPQAFQVNVEGTRAVVDTARAVGVKCFIHLSACAVLGVSSSPERLLDETASASLGANQPYALTKKLAEDLLLERGRRGLDVRIARFSTVYGPGDARMNSGSILRTVQKGMLAVPPGGTSYIGVGDLVEGLLAIAERGRAGESYILSGGNLTYRELTRRIADVLGVAPPRWTLPALAYGPLLAAAWLASRLRRDDPQAVELLTPSIVREIFRYKYFSTAKAERELGWQPRQSLEESVAAAVTWYREHHLLP